MGLGTMTNDEAPNDERMTNSKCLKKSQRARL
jgi:hypothetical protein